MARHTNYQQSGKEERRWIDQGTRANRLKIAGLSTPIGVALAVLVVEGVKLVWDVDLSNMFFLSLASILGSLTTTGALCFHDLRAIVLARFLKRRGTDV